MPGAGIARLRRQLRQASHHLMPAANHRCGVTGIVSVVARSCRSIDGSVPASRALDVEAKRIIRR